MYLGMVCAIGNCRQSRSGRAIALRWSPWYHSFMTQITVQGEEGLVKLSHSRRELNLVDGQGADAKRWWQMFKSRPPIGVDGHLLFPKDCSLRDVIEAVGMELSKEEGERLLKTMPPLPAIPANATP